MTKREVIAWYVAYAIVATLAGLVAGHAYSNSGDDGALVGASIMTMTFGAIWIHASNRIPDWYPDRQ